MNNEKTMLEKFYRVVMSSSILDREGKKENRDGGEIIQMKLGKYIVELEYLSVRIMSPEYSETNYVSISLRKRFEKSIKLFVSRKDLTNPRYSSLFGENSLNHTIEDALLKQEYINFMFLDNNEQNINQDFDRGFIYNYFYPSKPIMDTDIFFSKKIINEEVLKTTNNDFLNEIDKRYIKIKDIFYKFDNNDIYAKKLIYGGKNEK